MSHRMMSCLRRLLNAKPTRNRKSGCDRNALATSTGKIAFGVSSNPSTPSKRVKRGSILDRPNEAFQVLDSFQTHLDTTIGPFQLIELLGEGGMGLVYLAEQSHPIKRRVAIKIVKPGMDSRGPLSRFEAERQTLPVWIILRSRISSKPASPIAANHIL